MIAGELTDAIWRASLTAAVQTGLVAAVAYAAVLAWRGRRRRPCETCGYTHRHHPDCATGAPIARRPAGK